MAHRIRKMSEADKAEQRETLRRVWSQPPQTGEQEAEGIMLGIIKRREEREKEAKKLLKGSKKLDKEVSEQNKKHVERQTEKAKKLMAEVQKLMDEVSAFKMPEIKKPKLPRALKHAMSTKAKVPPPPPKKRTMSTKAVVPPAPKKKSKAQQEREMAEYINRPEVQTERRIKYILKKIAVNVQMMENAVEYMKYINKEKYEASAEIKETYKTNKKLFLHYRDEGIEELKELKQLSKEVSKETLEKEMSDSRAGEKFVEFNKLKTYKPKF